jgi:hypothetical protein
MPKSYAIVLPDLKNAGSCRIRRAQDYTINATIVRSFRVSLDYFFLCRIGNRASRSKCKIAFSAANEPCQHHWFEGMAIQRGDTAVPVPGSWPPSTGQVPNHRLPVVKRRAAQPIHVSNSTPAGVNEEGAIQNKLDIVFHPSLFLSRFFLSQRGWAIP